MFYEYTTFDDKQLLRTAKAQPFLPAFHQFSEDYVTAYQYNITMCSIRKSMSQMVFNIMCLLHDTENFLAGNHTIGETWENKRSCNYDVDGFARFPPDLKNTSHFTRVVFIRDPFDRFLSFYLDKCMGGDFSCFGCKGDMRCLVERVYSSLKNIVLPQNTSYSPSFMEMHSAPTSWYCDFDKYLKAYNVIIIGTDKEQRQTAIMKLSDILERRNVPDDIIYKIVKGTLVGETSHGTHKSARRKLAEQQIRNDPIVREYLHKLYLNDYLVFPFDKSPLDPKYQTGEWKEKFDKKYSNIIQNQVRNSILFS